MTKSKIQPNQTRNSYLKYISFGVAIIFILGLVTGIFVKDKIRSRIESIDGLSHRNIKLSLITRRITVNEIQFEWKDDKGEHSKINCFVLDISGISWWDFLKHNELNINNLSIEKVNGKIKSIPLFSQKIDVVSTESNTLKKIYVKDVFLKVTDMDFTHVDGWNAKMEDLDFHIHKFHFPISQKDQSLQYEDFKLSFANATWMLRDGLYSLHCKKWDSKMSSQNLVLDGFELRPRYNKADWKSKIPGGKDRLELKIPRVEMVKIDYQKLLAGEALMAENLILDQTDLDIFGSKNLTPCTDCYSAFLHEKFLNVKFPIEVKKIELKENRIHIVSANAQAVEVIDFSFEKIFASIYNVTNIKEKIKKNPKIVADVNAMFANETKLETQIKFHLNSPQFDYEIDAKLDQLDLTKINKIFDFGTKVRIESGQLDQLNFHIDGNNNLASGNMQFGYTNLKIKMLNDEKSKAKKLLSGLANLGLKNDNQKSKSGELREGKIYYLRVRNKGLFHQWVGAIQSGFKSTILPNILLQDELE